MLLDEAKSKLKHFTRPFLFFKHFPKKTFIQKQNYYPNQLQVPEIGNILSKEENNGYKKWNIRKIERKEKGGIVKITQ